jgi:oligoribonuclease
MKYVSIDIETTGLDRDRCQVLEFGAVIEDTLNLVPLEDLPAFRVLIRHPDLYWEDYPKALHKDLIIEFENPNEDSVIIPPGDLVKHFEYFLLSNGYREEKGRVRFNVAGKNFSGFDREFLERIPGWKKNFSISRRVLDPAILYVDFLKDNELPDLKECKARAGFSVTEVKHEALADAMDVIALLRKNYI